jgi:hypothetical protein
MPRERWKQRLLLPIALCALAPVPALFNGGSAAAIGVSSSKCRPVESTTLARDRHARIYSLPTRGTVAEEKPESVRVLGCLFGTGHALLLGTTVSWTRRESQIATEAFDVATPMAAYSIVFQGVDSRSVYVVVRNLRDGEKVSEFSGAPSVGVEQVSSVTDIEVTSSGSVAWIGQGHSRGSGANGAEVAVGAPGQPAEVLDKGNGIAPKSLELKGNTLSWINAGTRHAAPMP